MCSSLLFPDLENMILKQKKVELYIYADEVKKFENPNGESWMYIGLLIIPKDKKAQLYTCLMQARNKENYYWELHFKKIRKPSGKSIKTRLAKRCDA